jgi:hypothetical protein
MHIGSRETLAARERFGTRSHCFGDECAALFIQPSLVLNRLQHKCVGRFIGCFGCRYDPSFEVRGNLECGCYRGAHKSSVLQVLP